MLTGLEVCSLLPPAQLSQKHFWFKASSSRNKNLLEYEEGKEGGTQIYGQVYRETAKKTWRHGRRWLCRKELRFIQHKPEKYRKLQAYSICPVRLVSECRTFKMLSVRGGLTVHVHQVCSTWSRSTQHFQEAPDPLHKTVTTLQHSPKETTCAWLPGTEHTPTAAGLLHWETYMYGLIWRHLSHQGSCRYLENNNIIFQNSAIVKSWATQNPNAIYLQVWNGGCNPFQVYASTAFSAYNTIKNVWTNIRSLLMKKIAHIRIYIYINIYMDHFMDFWIF